MIRKTAVITGASRGIGRAAALLFARQGYNLALCCRQNTQLLDETARKAAESGASCLTCTGDLGNPAVCRDFFQKIDAAFPSIDVLINNAGISITGLFQDMTEAQWQEILSSNLSSAFYLSQEAVRRMLPLHRGCILNVSSVWGSAGASCEVAYSAVKGAINSMTRALAKELAPSHIRVNAAAFGAIDTDMNRFLSEEEKQALCEEIPMGRMGTCEEAAELLWRLSESPEYLTGQIVTMDGGWIG